MNEDQLRWYMGGLSQSEKDELYCLEYVLTWGYSDDEVSDEKRHKHLSNKMWTYRDNNPIKK